MIHDVIFLILGFGLIVLGGNFVTDGAVGVARRFNVPTLTIGLTVVALGSAMPDLVVCLIASLRDKPELAIGDVVGSNIFDLLLVTGAIAIISPVALKRSAWRSDIPMLFLSSLALFVVGDDTVVDRSSADVINRTDGLMLLMLFAFYMNRVMSTGGNANCHGANVAAPSSSATSTTPATKTSGWGVWADAARLVAGFGALIIGGSWLVDGAAGVARAWGMSEGLVGLTIVGIGSGAPDLASSVIAAVKKQPELAIGNIIGACIINVFMVLGASAAVNPLTAGSITTVDFSVLLGASALMLLFGTLARGHRIGRVQGCLLVICYIGYMAWLIHGALR